MIQLRPARIEDASLLLEMLRASATDQGFPDKVAVTEEDLRADGFGDAPLFHTLLAEAAGQPAGMALYFFNYSTWNSRLGLYLEDLYVEPAFRGKGVGLLLLTSLSEIARNHGCGRFQWLVHKENAAALRLYQKFGARAASDWLLMSAS